MCGLRVDLLTVHSPLFFVEIVVEFDEPPPCSVDANETGESKKCPWLVAVGLAINFTSTTHRYFVVFSVSLASRDQDGGPSRLNTERAYKWSAVCTLSKTRHLHWVNNW